MRLQGHSPPAHGGLPEAWNKASVTPAFQKGKSKDLGDYKLVSLTLIPGKVMEPIIHEAISKHSKDKKMAGSSQHRLQRGSLIT